MNKLLILSMMMMIKAEGGAQDGQMNEEGKETIDYMESDRVIGKE